MSKTLLIGLASFRRNRTPFFFARVFASERRPKLDTDHQAVQCTGISAANNTTGSEESRRRHKIQQYLQSRALNKLR